MEKILVTGGAGYIGTHTLIELDEAGFEFVVYDNLSNSSIKAINRVEKIINKKITFIDADIRDNEMLNKVFNDFKIFAVIHFAGLKAVGESVKNPLEYYDNNVNGSVQLLKVMKRYNCKKIVFSSSATVYGESETIPINEKCPVGKTTNPYGTTKLFIEQILQDLYKSDNSWDIAILRYFNPVGAHQSGLIGEDPNGIPNNLMPYILQVASGKLPYLNIFGNDYPTKDGTGVRDFIHVVDLANAHVKAIQYLNKKDKKVNPLIVNLGTGIGYSVLDLVNKFEEVNGVKIDYKFTKRRDGDIAICYADASLAKELIGWEAKRGIEDMCRDGWNWQKNNKSGYN